MHSVRRMPVNCEPRPFRGRIGAGTGEETGTGIGTGTADSLISLYGRSPSPPTLSPSCVLLKSTSLGDVDVLRLESSPCRHMQQLQHLQERVAAFCRNNSSSSGGSGGNSIFATDTTRPRQSAPPAPVSPLDGRRPRSTASIVLDAHRGECDATRETLSASASASSSSASTSTTTNSREEASSSPSQPPQMQRTTKLTRNVTPPTLTTITPTDVESFRRDGDCESQPFPTVVTTAFLQPIQQQQQQQQHGHNTDRRAQQQDLWRKQRQQIRLERRRQQQKRQRLRQQHRQQLELQQQQQQQQQKQQRQQPRRRVHFFADDDNVDDDDDGRDDYQNTDGHDYDSDLESCDSYGSYDSEHDVDATRKSQKKENDANDDDDDEDKDKKKKKRRKSVSVSIHLVPSLIDPDEFTDEERCGVWYSAQDIDDIQCDVSNIISEMRRGMRSVPLYCRDEKSELFDDDDEKEEEGNEDATISNDGLNNDDDDDDDDDDDYDDGMVRGLEHMATSDKLEARRLHKRAAIDAVLNEQSSQRHRRVVQRLRFVGMRLGRGLSGKEEYDLKDKTEGKDENENDDDDDDVDEEEYAKEEEELAEASRRQTRRAVEYALRLGRWDAHVSKGANKSKRKSRATNANTHAGHGGGSGKNAGGMNLGASEIRPVATATTPAAAAAAGGAGRAERLVVPSYFPSSSYASWAASACDASEQNMEGENEHVDDKIDNGNGGENDGEWETFGGNDYFWEPNHRCAEGGAWRSNLSSSLRLSSLSTALSSATLTPTSPPPSLLGASSTSSLSSSFSSTHQYSSCNDRSLRSSRSSDESLCSFDPFSSADCSWRARARSSTQLAAAVEAAAATNNSSSSSSSSSPLRLELAPASAHALLSDCVGPSTATAAIAPMSCPSGSDAGAAGSTKGGGSAIGIENFSSIFVVKRGS